MKNQCINCRFWAKTNQCQRGQCRRHAPLYEQAGRNTEGHTHAAKFPETQQDSWCGDYEIKEGTQ